MIRSLRLFFHPSKTSPLPPIAGVAIVFRSFYFGSFATQLQRTNITNRLTRVNTLILLNAISSNSCKLLSATDREDMALQLRCSRVGRGAPDICRGSKCVLGVQGDDINHCAASYRQSCSCNFPLQDLDIFRF